MDVFDLEVLNDLDIVNSSPALVFASGGYKNRFRAVQVRFQPEIAAELQDTCIQTLDRLRGLIPQPYDPDSTVEEGAFLFVEISELLDPSLINVISQGASLDSLEHDETLGKVFCYAVVYGPGDDPVAIFIKKSNPVTVPKSRWFARWMGENTLTKIDQPEISFYDWFDAVVVPGRYVICWDTKTFNQLFKTEEIVLAHTEAWIRATFDRVEGYATADILALVAQARVNARVRNKWHVASSRPALSEEAATQLESAIRSGDLDDRLEVVDGKIIVTPENLDAFFGLLNEDDYTGRLTGIPYRAQSKVRR